MSNRAPYPVPTAWAVPLDDVRVPNAVPVDAAGVSLIPELRGREPTPHERELLSGDPIYLGSSNVSNILWQWQTRSLFIEFLSGDIYRYENVPLDVAAGFLATDSPGRYVWNVIRTRGYSYTRTVRGTGDRRTSQVIRLRDQL